MWNSFGERSYKFFVDNNFRSRTDSITKIDTVRHYKRPLCHNLLWVKLNLSDIYTKIRLNLGTFSNHLKNKGLVYLLKDEKQYQNSSSYLRRLDDNGIAFCSSNLSIKLSR